MNDLENVSSELMDRSYKLMNAFVKSSSLDSLAQCASEILGNPFIFIDTSYNIVAHSNNNSMKDKICNKCITLGYLSDEITKEIISKYRKFDMDIKTNQPFERVLESSLYKWIVSNSYFNEHLCGTINMLCLNEFNMENELDISTLKIISDMFAKSMVSNKNNSINDIVPYEDVFKDLIVGDIKNKILLKNRIVGTELEYVRSFLLINVYFEVHIHSLMSDFRNKLKSIPFHGWVFYHEKYLLILVDTNCQLIKSDKLYIELERLLNIFSIKACISDKFDDLSYLFDYYQKNKRALKFSNQFESSETLISYGKYRFYDMVSIATESMPQKNVTQFIDQRIVEIRDYDKINKTEYFLTLLTFLKNNRSYKMTAEKLFTHKNTIVYRISRLNELYGLDFENCETFFNLYYSCEILNCYNKLF